MVGSGAERDAHLFPLHYYQSSPPCSPAEPDFQALPARDRGPKRLGHWPASKASFSTDGVLSAAPQKIFRSGTLRPYTLLAASVTPTRLLAG